MKIMEFPAKFINWVRQCASTAMFSIVINGERVGYFLGKRGLRQRRSLVHLHVPLSHGRFLLPNRHRFRAYLLRLQFLLRIGTLGFLDYDCQTT